MNRRPVMVAATEFWDGATGSGLARGFRELGWLVQQVDRGEFGGSARTLALRAASRLARKGMERAYRASIRQACEALRPDVFFTVKGTGLSAELLERLQHLGTRTVMYYPDVEFDHPGVDPRSFRFYDLFVTTKSFQLPWLRERLGAERTAYIPHGFSDVLFQPVFDAVADAQCQFDVLYVGNHSVYKQHWLERLVELSPGLKLGIAGNRWRDLKRSSILASASLLGEVRGIGLARLIQSSRINIGLHFGTTQSGWEDLVSTRSFEIPACKGFMLHIDNVEVRDLFEVGREIDVFASPEDLCQKIQFYLARPELRSQMAERAFLRAVPAYGYAQRAAQIDQLLRARQWLGAHHACAPR